MAKINNSTFTKMFTTFKERKEKKIKIKNPRYLKLSNTNSVREKYQTGEGDEPGPVQGFLLLKDSFSSPLLATQGSSC